MTCFEVDAALKSMKILVDTREQDTPALRRRIKAMECGVERVKLDVGDYSCKCTLPDGTEYDLSNVVVVERKYDLTELCTCFCQQRKRFIREFERAKENGTKVYLMVENAQWKKVYTGAYRSKMSAPALRASLWAWLSRYNCQIIFCESQFSGEIIKDIMYRELKEHLEKIMEGTA
ncbi:ERCC4 domain-containing protein [Christensenella hongkongensis]|uniref:ERCC4 domain-containing protein n=2 Tax=Christensenella hongkongensis TaxID=270498 RepID=A0A0M2NMZ6_9FIRM|nr:ERCC4 domain-containing protein [Christensenella hongkongensis]KKI51792.1 hypothetical protein CHK_0677 [Christensenella hongkongensis]